MEDELNVKVGDQSALYVAEKSRGDAKFMKLSALGNDWRLLFVLMAGLLSPQEADAQVPTAVNRISVYHD